MDEPTCAERDADYQDRTSLTGLRFVGDAMIEVAA